MSEVITIPSTTLSGGVTFYTVSIKLPLRSLTIDKRYSEFEDLVNNLAGDLGITKSDFPYQLPSKRIKWLNNSSTVAEERKQELARFLNLLIKDSSVQNNPILLNFLKLPINFKFNSSLFKGALGDNRVSDLLVDLSSIDENNWLEIHRIFKSNLAELLSEAPTNMTERSQIRDKINKLLQPCLLNLTKSLHGSKLNAKEFTRRETLLSELKTSMDELINGLQGGYSHNDEQKLFKRVLGKPQETKDTMLLNNNELLQAQVQVHQAQDQELEQLRKIIQRQREISEAIHTEVEEQNTMLDQFNDEVYNTTEKLRTARNNAKRIL